MLRSRFLSILAIGGASLLLVGITARPQDSTPALETPPGFDLAAEMAELYGNYDSAAGLSFVPSPSVDQRDLWRNPSEKLEVRAFFLAAVPSSNSNEVLLATFGLPHSGNFNCYACAPSIGAALFKKAASGWMREASEPPFFEFGEFGKHPDAKLVQFGAHHYGIELEDKGDHHGNTFTATALFLPWNGKFSDAFRTDTMGNNTEDESAECRSPEQGEDNNGSPCYAYHRELRFVPGRNSQYYDLVVTTSGTDLIQGNKVVDVSGTVRLRFVDGKYRAD